MQPTSRLERAFGTLSPNQSYDNHSHCIKMYHVPVLSDLHPYVFPDNLIRMHFHKDMGIAFVLRNVESSKANTLPSQ